jgi:hypothetical protein
MLPIPPYWGNIGVDGPSINFSVFDSVLPPCLACVEEDDYRELAVAIENDHTRRVPLGLWWQQPRECSMERHYNSDGTFYDLVNPSSTPCCTEVNPSSD